MSNDRQTAKKTIVSSGLTRRGLLRTALRYSTIVPLIAVEGIYEIAPLGAIDASEN